MKQCFVGSGPLAVFHDGLEGFFFGRILGHRHFFFVKESTLPLPVAARRGQCVSELTHFTKSFAKCDKKKEDCFEITEECLG